MRGTASGPGGAASAAQPTPRRPDLVVGQRGQDRLGQDPCGTRHPAPPPPARSVSTPRPGSRCTRRARPAPLGGGRSTRSPRRPGTSPEDPRRSLDRFLHGGVGTHGQPPDSCRRSPRSSATRRWRLHRVGRALHPEEPVPGPLVAVEVESSWRDGQVLVHPGDVLGPGGLASSETEQPEQGAVQIRAADPPVGQPAAGALPAACHHDRRRSNRLRRRRPRLQAASTLCRPPEQ